MAQKLHDDGVGVHVKHAEVMIPNVEAHLWNAGVVGVPSALLNAAFFMNGKKVFLRGGW